MKLKVLVTGAAGFFGRHIMAEFERDTSFEVEGLTRHELDITHSSAVFKAVDELRPAIVVNCAGITGQKNCANDPSAAVKTNVYGVANLADCCESRGILLIQPSTVAVFDGISGNYREKTPPSPQPGNHYAETKAKAEQRVWDSGANFIVPRMTTGYGPIHPHDTTNFLKVVLERLEKKQLGSYFDDHFTNPVEIREVAQAIRQLVKIGYQGLIIHLGGPEIISLFEFAQRIKEEFGEGGLIERGSVKGSGYPPNMTLDTTLAESVGIKFSGILGGMRSCKL